MTSNYRIVVGVDGSDGGRRALTWAVHEAAARGATVQAVYAWRWDASEFAPHAAPDIEHERQRVEQVLAQEIESVPGFDRSSVTIATEAVEGRAADVLTEAAQDADLLVLGSHGHSRVHHTVLGSVSEECVRKARCPVVVLPVSQAAAERPAEPAVRT